MPAGKNVNQERRRGQEFRSEDAREGAASTKSPLQMPSGLNVIPPARNNSRKKIHSMKIIPATLACLLFAAMPFARVAQAQTHSVYGDKRANTTDDLKIFITQLPYTWEAADGRSMVKFNADSSGKQSSFSFTWHPRNAQQIELDLAGRPTQAVITFNSDYTAYTGTDFDGHAFHGSVIAPAGTKATPPPTPPALAAVAPAPTAPAAAPSMAPAATPASTGSNPFLAESSSDPGGALQKAIVNSTYTWEPEADSSKTVTFLPNGVGRSTFFNITWRIKGPHELEIGIADGKTRNKIVMRFNSDFSKYTATDFDGESKLKGRKMAPGEN